MATEIFKKFRFDAAHSLPQAPDGHKCRRVHGHTFEVAIHVTGDVGEESGWIIDFADIKKAFNPLLEQFDHHYLNEIEGLEQPTCENLCKWIWDRLKPQLPGLCKIVVMENETCGAIYTG